MNYMPIPMEPSNNSIIKELEDLGISYIVEHRKVKYFRVEFKSENQLLIILPLKIKDETEVLVKDRKWIKKKLGDIKTAIKSVEDYKKLITDDTKILLFGEFYQIIKLDGKYDISIKDNNLQITVPKNQAHLSYFRKWLRMELKRKISKILFELSKDLNVNYHNIVIKSQKSKWGSCSSKGNLNFNLRLIALPSEVVRYVALHELIHINNRYHDKHFWKSVSDICPDYEIIEQKLLGFWFLLKDNKIWNLIEMKKDSY